MCACRQQVLPGSQALGGHQVRQGAVRDLPGGMHGAGSPSSSPGPALHALCHKEGLYLLFVYSQIVLVQNRVVLNRLSSPASSPGSALHALCHKEGLHPPCMCRQKGVTTHNTSPACVGLNALLATPVQPLCTPAFAMPVPTLPADTKT